MSARERKIKYGPKEITPPKTPAKAEKQKKDRADFIAGHVVTLEAMPANDIRDIIGLALASVDERIAKVKNDIAEGYEPSNLETSADRLVRLTRYLVEVQSLSTLLSQFEGSSESLKGSVIEWAKGLTPHE